MQLTQKLVEQDSVFAIFNSIGTEHALAVRDVPERAQGAAALRRQRRGARSRAQHAKYPWTIGLLPSFAGEGAIYGRLIAKDHPKAKIGVLYENDEYGQRAARRPQARPRLARRTRSSATQSYALLDTSVVVAGRSR